mmetsp:Transcript_27264/g.26311  ORF Transcript_27264/g.26311 Transcript_27264/m.26311 type:complete len:149 (-) Transcript_27264:699-1145(-)
MSRKQLDIKRALIIISKEYAINEMVSNVLTFLNAEALDYIIKKKGEFVWFLFRVNRYAPKFLKVKEVKVWVRDILNNSIWTQNSNNTYEMERDLGRFVQTLNTLKPSFFMAGSEFVFTLPLISPLDKNVLGFVEITPFNNVIEEQSLE